MNITSRQLKAFLLTAQYHSFSRAAEDLYITQSGMSVLIRKLEDQLGFRLFERTTRRVELTAYGEKFLPIANRNLLDLDVAAANISRAASAADRRLEVGANPLFAKTVLPAVMREYAKRDARLEVILHDGYRNELAAAVGTGEIDMAFGCFLQPIPGMRRKPLHRFPLMLVAPEGEVPGDARGARWEDLAERRLLGAPAGNPIQQLVDRQLLRVGRHKPPEMRFHYYETYIAMVEAGAGVAVLPSFCYPACHGHKVAMVPLVEPLVTVDFYQISSRGRRLPPGSEEFSRYLQRYIAELAESWALADARAA
ncbi:MAG: LysR family transcriptional regulator [Betaproteobacteria bacterium]|nr:LysR family transcriptional regulator [Betaproteobacteria bacterium]MDH5212208.1 LysR family transcriptional regulator [Betaproteobacteria bacterium]